MSTVTVPSRTLRMMLAAVLPHADRDDMLPALNAVLFEVRSGVLYLAATDRYGFGVARYPVPGAAAEPPPDQAALLDLTDTQNMFDRLADADEGRPAALVITGERLTLDSGPVDSWDCLPVDMANPWPSKTTPWWVVLGRLLTAKPCALDSQYGMDMRLPARFSIDTGPFMPYGDPEDEPPEPEWPEEACRLRIVGEARMLVTRGDWFIGAVMGHRMPKATATPPAWDDWKAVCEQDEAVKAGAA